MVDGCVCIDRCALMHVRSYTFALLGPSAWSFWTCTVRCWRCLFGYKIAISRGGELRSDGEHGLLESLAAPGVIARTAAVSCDVAAPAITVATLLRNGFENVTCAARQLKTAS